MSFVERRGFDCDRVGIPDVSWESRVVIEGREGGSLSRDGLGKSVAIRDRIGEAIAVFAGAIIESGDTTEESIVNTDAASSSGVP